MMKTKYENYFADEYGNIYSNKSGIMKPIKTSINNRGYEAVNFSDKGVRTSRLVHRVMVETFISEDLKNLTVNHKDGNKLNNHIDNLELVSQKENNQHALSTGLTPIGENHSRAKIKDADLVKMIQEVQSGLSTVKASKKYGLSQSYVSKVMRKVYRKDIWKSV